MAVVAIAACEDAEPGTIYPDADWPFLRAALEAVGTEVTLVPWNWEGVDWRRFDSVIIRSTWDSVDRPDAFLGWARTTAPITILLNPVEAVTWNLDKRYLRALEARGVPIVPTQWVLDEGDWTPPSYEFVVKPSISAGARETARYGPDECETAGSHVRRLLGRGQAVMVQPYLAGVDTDGESKLVFVDGAFSHAIRVGPQLPAGAGVRERPWELPMTTEPAEASVTQLEAARRVLAAVDAELGVPLLYARVDLVAGADGAPLLGEIELIDPSLFLRLVPGSADRLAGAIVRRVSHRH